MLRLRTYAVAILLCTAGLALAACPAGRASAQSDVPAEALSAEQATAPESAVPADNATAATAAPASSLPWWFWPLALFVFCVVLGMITVLSGTGGGVLYVSLVGAFFPFHIDFVRGTSLIMALAGAVAAGPGLLRHGLAKLRLALPCAVIASLGSLVGGAVGLMLPAGTIQVLLGFVILLITAVLLASRNVEFPRTGPADRLSVLLRISGVYHERTLGQDVEWHAHRTPLGMVMFLVVGFMGGMFGLGAGWANVPVFNLIMGAPLKVAVGSSVFLISISNTTAAWIYLKNGAWLPLIAIPSIVGLMLGTMIGVRLLGRSRPRSVRYIVIGLMVFAAISSLLKGFGVWT